MKKQPQDPAFDPPDGDAQIRMVEAILFSSAAPLSATEIQERMPLGSDAAATLRAVEARYKGRGVEVKRTAGKWALRTAPDLAFLLRREAAEERRLSRAAIETLAIIAYHQPTTRAEIEEIRGVSVSSGTVDLLMEAGWVKIGRRRESPGRPVTFLTTDHFLDHFGLENVRDLPGLAELKASGLLDNRPKPGTRPLFDAEDAAYDDPDDDDSEDEDPLEGDDPRRAAF